MAHKGAAEFFFRGRREPKAAFPPWSILHRALRRMTGLVFLLVFWALAGACQRNGVGGFLCVIQQQQGIPAMDVSAAGASTPPALEFYLGEVVDLKPSPPCVAPSR